MFGRIILGFIAGMLAVLMFHQPIIYGLAQVGLLPPTARVYNMAAFPNAPAAVAAAFKGFGFAGWPTLFNQMFWGGMWGVAFGAVYTSLPGHALVKGLLLGLVMLVLANWIVLPYVRGTEMFAGLVPLRMAIGATISIGFALGLALLFSLMRREA